MRSESFFGIVLGDPPRLRKREMKQLDKQLRMVWGVGKYRGFKWKCMESSPKHYLVDTYHPFTGRFYLSKNNGGDER